MSGSSRCIGCCCWSLTSTALLIHELVTSSSVVDDEFDCWASVTDDVQSLNVLVIAPRGLNPAAASVSSLLLCSTQADTSRWLKSNVPACFIKAHTTASLRLLFSEYVWLHTVTRFAVIHWVTTWLPSHWTVRQKLNRASSDQFSCVALYASLNYNCVPRKLVSRRRGLVRKRTLLHWMFQPGTFPL